MRVSIWWMNEPRDWYERQMNDRAPRYERDFRVLLIPAAKCNLNATLYLSLYFASHLCAFVRHFYRAEAERVGEAVTTDPGVSSRPFPNTYSSSLACLLVTRTWCPPKYSPYCMCANWVIKLGSRMSCLEPVSHNALHPSHQQQQRWWNFRSTSFRICLYSHT